MSFVYPSFLWALLLLLIPVLIHLFNFRRVKKILFTNVRFLKKIKTETNAIKRIKEILIMLTRMGFIAFLVIAFAQPFLPSTQNQIGIKENSITSIYFDNSYSMQSEYDNKSYFDWTREAIVKLSKTFSKTGKFQLINNDFLSKEQFVSSAQGIEDLLTDISLSNKYRSAEEVLNRQHNLLKNVSNVKNQIFYFSDFQKSTLGNIDLPFDTTHQYYFVPIKSQTQANIAIDSVWLSNPFVKENEENTVNIIAHNYGKEPVKDHIFRLFVDDIQVATTSLSIEENHSTEASFSFTVQGKGQQRCSIAFEDYPITFDNQYYFMINVAPKIEILHIYEGNASQYIRDVFSSEQSFYCKHMTSHHIDAISIETSQVIILNGVPNISNVLFKNLMKHIKKGGLLVIFPPNSPNASYKELLSACKVRGYRNLQMDSQSKSIKNTLDAPDLSLPFYKGVFDKVPNNIDMPYAIPSIRWINAGTNILRYSNGLPYASFQKVGKGALYIFASSLESSRTDLSQNALFVPLMYKIATSIKQEKEQLSYTFQNKNIVLSVPEASKAQVYKFKRDDLEFVPAQRQSGRQLFLELPPDAYEAGYYDLYANDKKIMTLAFNYGMKESAMQHYDTKALKAHFKDYKNVHVFEDLTDEVLISTFQKRNKGITFWKYAVIAALIFLLLEILIIRFIK